MIKDNYNRVLNEYSDIRDNLPILKYFAKQCSHITEMGVRGMVSTWAFLDGVKTGGVVIGIDWENPLKYGVNIDVITKGCEQNGVIFKFIKGNTLKIKIEPTDFLFIDTVHTKEQLSKELKLHASKVKKFIGFHDTVLCPEIREPIEQFIYANPSWEVVFNGGLSNGLIVIQKI